MTRRHQNHHVMHADVLAVLDHHAALWTSRDRVVPHVDALRDAYAQAAETDARREALRPKGLTRSKETLRAAMKNQTLALAKAVRPFGRDTGDDALVDAATFTETDFKRASEAGAVSLAERVLRAAEPHDKKLPPYGAAAGAVDALRAAIEAFRPAGGARDAVRSQQEALTRAMPPLFKAAKAAIAQLDDLVPGIGDETLAAEYTRARRIDDR